jgi:hypothetical protein
MIGPFIDAWLKVYPDDRARRGISSMASSRISPKPASVRSAKSSTPSRRSRRGYVPVIRFGENVVAADEAHSAIADRLRCADAEKLTLLVRRRLGGAVDVLGDDLRRRGQPTPTTMLPSRSAFGNFWRASAPCIDVQILRLRRRLESDPSAPSIIRTERGVGYAFTLPVEPL